MAAIALTSCSNDENPQIDSDAVIRLGAGVVTTKAPINDLAGLSAMGTNVGIYAVPSVGTWTATQLMQNVQTTAIDPTTGAISWEPGIYYYPTDGSSLNFYGYYPFAAEGTTGNNYVTASDGTNAPKLNFTIDGTQDIMYATSVTGNKSTAPGKLTFNHALTQIHFLALKGTADAGTTIKSISVKKANSQSTMDITDGTLGTWATPSTFNALVNATVTIPQLPTEITGATPLMVQPGLSEMLIDVTTALNGTETTFNDIKIKPEGDVQFKAGTSYAITLTFNSKVSQTPIQISADVTPWLNSGKGNGTVQ